MVLVVGRSIGTEGAGRSWAARLFIDAHIEDRDMSYAPPRALSVPRGGRNVGRNHDFHRNPLASAGGASLCRSTDTHAVLITYSGVRGRVKILHG